MDLRDAFTWPEIRNNISVSDTGMEWQTRMPTVKIIGPYRFFFFSNEGNELPHIHVTREKSLAKFWIRSVMLASTSGFKGAELRKLENIVTRNQSYFLEAWDAYFTG